jgi:non-homologous end joining protein Ku
MTPTLAEETFAVIAPTTTILAKIAVLKFVLSVRKKTIMSIPTLFAWTAENLTNL